MNTVRATNDVAIRVQLNAMENALARISSTRAQIRASVDKVSGFSYFTNIYNCFRPVSTLPTLLSISSPVSVHEKKTC
jgi:hypothetical protein